MAGTTTKTLPLNQLTFDGELQPRETLNLTTISALADEIASGVKLEPCDVFYEKASGKYWFAHGWHRAEAYRKEGIDSVPCAIHAGTRDDAMWFAAGQNLKGQTPRTPGDKKKAILTALKTDAAKQMSVKQIAKHCGVSPGYVSRIQNPPQLQGEVFTSKYPAVQEGGGDFDIQPSPFTKAGLSDPAGQRKAAKSKPETDVQVIEDDGEPDPPEPVTCPNCGGHEVDEDGDCTKCREPGVVKPADSKPQDSEAAPPEQTTDDLKAKARKHYEATVRGFALLGIHADCANEFAQLLTKTKMGKTHQRELKKVAKADLGRLQRASEKLVDNYEKTLKPIFAKLYKVLG